MHIVTAKLLEMLTLRKVLTLHVFVLLYQLTAPKVTVTVYFENGQFV